MGYINFDHAWKLSRIDQSWILLFPTSCWYVDIAFSPFNLEALMFTSTSNSNIYHRHENSIPKSIFFPRKFPHQWLEIGVFSMKKLATMNVTPKTMSNLSPLGKNEHGWGTEGRFMWRIIEPGFLTQWILSYYPSWPIYMALKVVPSLSCCLQLRSIF